MKQKIQIDLVKLAADKAGPFSTAVAGSLDKGNLGPTKIAASLDAAGLVTEYEDGKTGTWCRVYRPFTAEERAAAKEGATDADCRSLAAQGFAPDRDSAFLYAVFGAVREEHARNAVAKALDKKGVKVDDKLRAELERRFILEGGPKRLAEDMKAFDKATA